MLFVVLSVLVLLVSLIFKFDVGLLLKCVIIL